MEKQRWVFVAAWGALALSLTGCKAGPLAARTRTPAPTATVTAVPTLTSTRAPTSTPAPLQEIIYYFWGDWALRKTPPNYPHLSFWCGSCGPADQTTYSWSIELTERVKGNTYGYSLISVEGVTAVRIRYSRHGENFLLCEWKENLAATDRKIGETFTAEPGDTLTAEVILIGDSRLWIEEGRNYSSITIMEF